MFCLVAHYWRVYNISSFRSVGFCDVDEKGVQYMLLCRAILGNTGVIKPGSQEEFLRIYDSGVDNCSNPNYYVMWPSHLGTHISLEYLISFRLAPKVQGNIRRLVFCSCISTWVKLVIHFTVLIFRVFS
jgi:hypothetical protein